MKKKKYIALIAALTLSSAFVLNGCSLALPGEETKISTGAELSAEQEILTDGNVQLHTRWYNADGSRLVGATVTVYDGNDQLFQGTTDENGNLEACTLPGNKELRCVITDSSENELAKSDILYKISDNYQAIGEADTQKVEIPTSKTVLSAAIYLTENKTLSHANITEYIASDEENTTDAATDGTATDAAQPTDGQQQADPNSADANATDANQQSDAATQSTDQGADQAQTQPATDQQPVVTQ